MDFILQYFASSEVYGILLLSVFIGAITQSAIGIGFGIPGCVILLFDASTPHSSTSTTDSIVRVNINISRLIYFLFHFF